MSPTSNFTDATLKGSVTGPTFTGSVDGAKFTGSVTTADTPVPPDPTGPTGGLITAFNPAHWGVTTIDGVTYHAHTYGNSESYGKKKLDDYTIRYEIRQGTGGWNNTVDVSELECAQHLHDGDPVTIAYRIMVEPGAANSSSWMVCGIEWHNDDSQSPTYTSPMFVTEALGDKFSVVIRYPKNGNISPSGCTMKRLWTAPSNFVRGQWYIFEIEAKPSLNNGYFRCKVDGVQVANYTGPVGYGYDGYGMFGLYRNAAPETFAIQIKNLTVSWAK